MSEHPVITGATIGGSGLGGLALTLLLTFPAECDAAAPILDRPATCTTVLGLRPTELTEAESLVLGGITGGTVGALYAGGMLVHRWWEETHRKRVAGTSGPDAAS